MGRSRKAISAFAGLTPEIKEALRASSVTVVQPVSSVAAVVDEPITLDYGIADEPDPSLFAPAQRPAKRRRTDEDNSSELDEAPSSKKPAHALSKGLIPSDATSLVPFYASEDDVPAHLQKYWCQRDRLFSRFSEGCLLDEEGWYSVTPERVANQIADRCACNVILDAFCGVGGNAIAFAQTCERVIAIDNSPTRLALARHNAKIYGVADRIEFILGDFLDFARSSAARKRGIDVVFLSPPWGGPSYLTSSPTKATAAAADYLDAGAHPEYSLSSILPIHGADLFKLARTLTPHVAYFLPRNTDPAEISGLVKDEPTGADGVEIEEEWMGNKLKALTCYFGGLATGQETLWQ
ncbi:S-adenosyl-L-methionine-dependent methyltransferase, partial [Exidia glandulosa HHB12029]